MSRLLAPSKPAGFFSFPCSGPGRASVWLVAVFLVAFGLWLMWAQVPRERGSFFADPLYGGFLLVAALSGSGGGVAGVLAILLRRERALLVAVSSIVGLVVLFSTLGQLAR